MANQVIETILTRRAVRKYGKQPVPRALLEQIVECGCYAPTGMGIQPWHFTVVTDRGILDRMSARNAELTKNDPHAPAPLKAAAAQEGFDNFWGAPCAILVSGKQGCLFADVDCANAVENMALAAESLGLGSCYLASFKSCLLGEAGEGLLRELGIPEGYTPNFALSIGYKEEAPVPGPRREGCVNWVE